MLRQHTAPARGAKGLAWGFGRNVVARYRLPYPLSCDHFVVRLLDYPGSAELTLLPARYDMIRSCKAKVAPITSDVTALRTLRQASM